MSIFCSRNDQGAIGQVQRLPFHGQYLAPSHAGLQGEQHDRAYPWVATQPHGLCQPIQFARDEPALPRLVPRIKLEVFEWIVLQWETPLPPSDNEHMSNWPQFALQGDGFHLQESLVSVSGEIACTKV